MEMCSRLVIFVLTIFTVVKLGVHSQSATTCTTPTKKQGQCVPIERCRNIYNILANPGQYATYINRAACTLPNVNRSICCQPEEVVKEQAVVSSPENATSSTTPITNNGQSFSKQTLMKPAHANANLLPTDCGQKTSDRISLGNVTQVFEYPWMAVLQYKNKLLRKQNIEDGCAGTLINKRYVLTAAHCIINTGNFWLVSVRLGEHTKNQDPDCIIYRDNNGEELERDCADPTEVYRIESHVVLPDYKDSTHGNDIGLLRLKKDVVMKDHIAPICLPVTPELRTKQLDKFIVTGWGATHASSGSKVLMEATLPSVDNAKCQKKYNKSRISINEQQICAGGQNNVDSCRGDSGGPLGFVVEYSDQTTRFVQFGIVSFGIASCGLESVPGVYSRVSSYMDWILDNIQP